MVISRRASEETAVVRMRIEGANPCAESAPLDRQSGVSAYFLGNDPSRWLPEVPHYARVEYRSIYPGIDLLYYGNGAQLEYDFVIRPGADPGRIRLSYEGAGLRIDDSGDL